MEFVAPLEIDEPPEIKQINMCLLDFIVTKYNTKMNVLSNLHFNLPPPLPDIILFVIPCTGITFSRVDVVVDDEAGIDDVEEATELLCWVHIVGLILLIVDLVILDWALALLLDVIGLLQPMLLL